MKDGKFCSAKKSLPHRDIPVGYEAGNSAPTHLIYLSTWLLTPLDTGFFVLGFFARVLRSPSIGTLGCEFVRATGNRATEQQRFCRLPVRCSAAMTLFRTELKKTNRRSAVLAKISPIDIYVRYLISTYDI